MKKWIFILGLLLLIGGNSSFLTTCNCWATAIVQTTDYISFPVVALDSVTGVECVPESVHIHVWRGSLTNTTVYSFREVGDGADLAQIDSVATGYAGAVPQQYYFHDQVQDIDGDGTAGVYTINVRLWRGTTPTSNWFSFQILTNSFNNAITAISVLLDDSLGSAKHEAILTNAVADSIAQAVADANKANFMADVDSVEDAIADANKPNFMADLDSLENAIADANKPNFADTANQCDMVMVSGDATAADRFETMLDGTGGEDLTLGRLRIYAAANETAFVAQGGSDGHGAFFGGGSSAYGLFATGYGGVYVYSDGSGQRAFRIEGRGANSFGLSIKGGAGAGETGYGVEIIGGTSAGDAVIVTTTSGDGIDLSAVANYGIDGSIHGTIDRVTVADSTTAAALGSADAETLAVIRNYAHAVIESVTAHAPHGDNWAAGTGVSAIADTVNAILDTLQAHAPHGDDWGQGAGSLTAITDTVNAILDTLQEGFGSRTAVPDTSSIKTMIQHNWDSDTDGELTVEPHGTGTRTVVIQCLDYTDSTTGISSVMIDVYDSTGGEYKQPLQSNTSGLCTLSLDDGRYTIHLKKTADAVSGGSPQYRGVASDTTHTFYIDQFDPGAPPSADMCRVWCIAYDLENNEVAGVRLTIQVPGRFMPLVYDGTPVSRYTRSAVSNDTGYVHIDIYEMEGTNRIKCEADTSLTVKANIELRFPTGEVIRTYKAIPDADDWEIEW